MKNKCYTTGEWSVVHGAKIRLQPMYLVKLILDRFLQGRTHFATPIKPLKIRLRMCIKSGYCTVVHDTQILRNPLARIKLILYSFVQPKEKFLTQGITLQKRPCALKVKMNAETHGTKNFENYWI